MWACHSCGWVNSRTRQSERKYKAVCIKCKTDKDGPERNVTIVVNHQLNTVAGPNNAPKKPRYAPDIQLAEDGTPWG